MELTFVATTPGSQARVKRPNACDSCKKRKKRCTHGIDDAGAEENIASLNSLDPGVKTTHSKKRHWRGAKNTLQQANERPKVWRFLGDLNPETVFQSTGEERQRSDQDNIGVWQNEGERDDHQRSNSFEARNMIVNNTMNNKQPFAATNNSMCWKPAEDYITILPSESDRTGLLNIYFSKINSILPILDEQAIKRLHRESRVPVMLMQAICLTAAKDKSAASHLILPTQSGSMSVREFCHVLYEALKIELGQKMEKDKVIVIRTLALMSLHVDDADGAEESSLHLLQAIHHSQTLGLHLGNAKEEMHDNSLVSLFWCLWSLDRLNACINGRPVMMSDRDIGLKPYHALEEKNFAFNTWMCIADLMDQVIGLYRPTADPNMTGWEEGFPGFEEVLCSTGGLNLEKRVLATLELFYHSVSILTCRTRNFKNPSTSTSSAVRQSLSALRIPFIITESSLDSPCPLPIVPYSLSLSLSVAYKHLRQTKVPTHVSRSLKELQTCCDQLDLLADMWWSARAMVKLGRRALKEGNRAPTISSQRVSNGYETSESSRRSLQPLSDIPMDPNHRVGETIAQTDLPDLPELMTALGDESAQLEDANFNNASAFEDIDHLLGDYLELNLPMDFGDPLFDDELFPPDGLV